MLDLAGIATCDRKCGEEMTARRERDSRLSVVLLPDSDWPSSRTETSGFERLRSLRSWRIMSSMESLTFLASVSALRRSSRARGDSSTGGWRAAARGSERVLLRGMGYSSLLVGMGQWTEEARDWAKRYAGFGDRFRSFYGHDAT